MTNAYIGSELELFEKAVNWKSYYAAFIRSYLNGKVLEVGAGIGGTTASLCDGTQESWTCLEPDVNLASEINDLILRKKIPSLCNVMVGTIEVLSREEIYDAILYIDVLEHIEKDASEIALAAQHLGRGGKLIVLVPAHQWLYSNFDMSIGHHKRFNKKSLQKVIPPSLKQIKLLYLDSVGMLASAANMLLLKQKYPSLNQIRFWDEKLIKASRYMDRILFHSVGKSLIGVWEKQ